MTGDSSDIFATNLLQGRVILVTGGGTGLGRAAARELVACGAQVVIGGGREEVLRATAQGRAASQVGGAVRGPGVARRIVAATLERHGRLDVLVNNAGG